MFLLLCCLLSSCGPFRQSFGRRAPIIETRFETVCDFVPLEDEERANESVRAGRGPLLPEYFDPYQPLVDDFKLSYGDILEIVVYGHDGLRDGRNPQSFPVASCGC